MRDYPSRCCSSANFPDSKYLFKFFGRSNRSYRLEVYFHSMVWSIRSSKFTRQIFIDNLIVTRGVFIVRESDIDLSLIKNTIDFLFCFFANRTRQLYNQLFCFPLLLLGTRVRQYDTTLFDNTAASIYDAIHMERLKISEVVTKTRVAII